MKKLMLVMLIVAVVVAAGCVEELLEPFEHETETIDELNNILDNIENETTEQTIKMLIEAPAEIERTNVEVKNIQDSIFINNHEIAPFKNRTSYNIERYELINQGKYIRYACKYAEEYSNGRTRLHFISVYAKVDDNKELILPLHVYAYNRMIEKRSGILEPYTAPEWNNNFVVVGGAESAEAKIEVIYEADKEH